MRKHFFYITMICIFYSCNSYKEPEVYVPTACDRYNSEFDKLKDRIKEFYSENINYYHLGKLNDAKRDIKDMLVTLDTFKCETKTHRAYTAKLLDSINVLQAKEIKNNEEEERNGEDMFMDGVKISGHKVLYDENAQPRIEIQLDNKTNVTLKAIIFQVQYCDRRHKQGLLDIDDEDCYQNILVRGPITPFSNGTCTGLIDINKLENPNRTSVVIFKIIREDGTLIKRIDHKGFEN